jgi:hypothetical protein
MADILGQKYGIQVRIGGDSAKTNGKIIQLPSFPVNADENVLPLIRGYCDHEAAHIRHSDFTVFNKTSFSPLEKFICNVIEDWRVEKELAELYPGCGQNFQWLIRHLFLNENEGMQISTDHAINITNWLILTFRSWDVQELAEKRDEFRAAVDSAFPGLTDPLDSVLSSIRTNCKSTQDAAQFAQKISSIIQKYLKNLEKQEQQQEQNQEDQGEIAQDLNDGASSQSKTQTEPSDKAGSDANADDELAEQEPDADTKSQEENQQSQDNCGDDSATSQSSEDSGEDDENQEDEEKAPAPAREFSPGEGGKSSEQYTPAQTEKMTPDESASILKKLLLANPGDLPEDLGSILENAIMDVSQQQGEQLTIAVEGAKKIHPLDTSEIGNVRQATTALRTRLQGLLQSVRLVRKRCGYVGHVNTGKLYKIPTGNAKVFLRKGEHIAANTAIHILLDTSGSMSQKISLASQSCYAVASALYEIRGISIGVTAFPSIEDGDTVAPILSHGQKMHTQFNMVARGSTPMASALWWVFQCLSRQREPRKIILVITDGNPDLYPETQTAIKGIRDLGMEVYAIGICADFVIPLFSQMNSRVIHDIQELAPAMFGILQKALLSKTSLS